MTANYTYSVTVVDSPCTLSIHVFESFPYLRVAGQYLLSINPIRTYSAMEETDELGNKAITIRFPAYPGEKLTVTLLQHMIIYEIAFNIDSSRIGDYDKSSPLYQTYTAAAKYIEADSPEIVAKSKQIIGDETNPYLQAKKIYQFVFQQIRYDPRLATWNPATEGALYTLQAGRGVCRHHAALFAALCRAAGIPAAEILGVWGAEDVINHSWAHFYLENYGWVPVEPTQGAWVKMNESSYFAALGDNWHVPMISVNYEYWIYDSRRCEIRDVFAQTTSHGPFVGKGLAIPRDIDPGLQPSSTMKTILEVERTIGKFQTQTLKAPESGNLIAEAKKEYILAAEEYVAGNYTYASQYAQKSMELAERALLAEQKYTMALAAIRNATREIERAKTEGRTQSINQATLLIENARRTLDAYQYDDATALAKEAEGMAKKSTAPSIAEQLYPVSLQEWLRAYWPYLSTAVMLLVLMVILMHRSRVRRGNKRKQNEDE